MTIGLLSLDKLKLQIKVQVGTEDEKEAANKILPVIAKHHFLLCTLLLFNALANECLPIFLDAVFPSWAAIVISISFVLLCGEIIPNALFTGPNQLMIAARFISLVYFLEFIFFPVAYPLGKLLDVVLGHEEDDNLNRDELAALVQIIRQNGTAAAKDVMAKNIEKNRIKGKQTAGSDSNSGDRNRLSSVEVFNKNDVNLSQTEVNVITGALSLTKMNAKSICIPYSTINMLSIDQILDEVSIEVIDRCGHSRLPVFKGPPEARDIIGYLLVKKLVKLNPEKAIPLRSLMPLSAPIVIGAAQTLLEVLSTFQTSQGHMALVSEYPEELK
jgi:metal transporter CNNM